MGDVSTYSCTLEETHMEPQTCTWLEEVSFLYKPGGFRVT